MPLIQQNKDGSLKITIPKDVARELKLKKGQALKYVEIEGETQPCIMPTRKGTGYLIQEDRSNRVLKIAIPAQIADLKGWKKGTFLDLQVNKEKNGIRILKIN